MARGKGEGSFRLRKDGRWEGQIAIDGARKSVYGESKKDVLEKLSRLRLESGVPLAEGAAMSLAAFIEGYWLPDVQKNREDTTYRSYAYTVRKYVLPYVGNIALKDLNPGVMLRLGTAHEKNSVPPPTSWYARILLKTAVRQAVSPAQLIPVNPFADVRFKKPEVKEFETWTADQFARVQAAAEERGDRLALFYYLDVAIGLRHSETLALKGKSFDPQLNELRVDFQLYAKRIPKAPGQKKGSTEYILKPTKTKASKATLPVSPEIIAAVRRHQLKYGLSNDDFLFTTSKGTHYTQGQVRRAFRVSIRRAGADIPKIRIHDLRHTCATLLLDKGKDLKDIQHQLRHKNYTITANTYAHVTKRKARATADTMADILRTGGLK